MSAGRQAEATEFAVAALAAIGFDHGLAHVELMMTESGPRLIEVNPRLAGGGMAGLVGELSTRSGEFRVRWGAHDVQLHCTGLKHIRHLVVGDLHLSCDVMELPADPGLSLVAFSAEAGTPADDALRLLASWAATHEPANARPDVIPQGTQTRRNPARH